GKLSDDDADYGVPLSPPADPTPPDNRNFTGWFTAAQGGERISSWPIKYPTANTVFYAQFSEQETFSVTYTADSTAAAEISGYAPRTFSGLEAGQPYRVVVLTDGFQRPGYELDYWVDAEAPTVPIHINQEITITRNVTLIAVWKLRSVSINYVINYTGGIGKTVFTRYLPYGSNEYTPLSATELETLLANHAAFEASEAPAPHRGERIADQDVWDKVPSLPIQGDVRIEVAFTKIDYPFKVTVYAWRDGSKSALIDEEIFQFNYRDVIRDRIAAQIIPYANALLPGYAVVNAVGAAAGTGSWTNTRPTTSGWTMPDEATMGTSSSLEVLLIPKDVAIRFNGTLGDGDPEAAEIQGKYENTINASQHDYFNALAARAAAQGKRWVCTVGATAYYNLPATFPLNGMTFVLEDIPSTAVYYSVSFARAAGDLSDGALPPALTNIEDGRAITPAEIQSCGTLSWNRHAFRGWSFTQNPLDTSKIITESFNVSSNITLYAVWEEEEPEVTYYTLTYARAIGDPSVGNLPSAQTGVEAGRAMQASDLAQPVDMSAEGYSFAGWSFSGEDALDTSKKITASFTMDGNKTVYALWEPVTPPEPGDELRLEAKPGTGVVVDEKFMMIYGFAEGVSSAQLIGDGKTTGGEYLCVNRDGGLASVNTLNSNRLATGDVVTLTDEITLEKKDYHLVLFGDVNGDSYINSVDAKACKEYIGATEFPMGAIYVAMSFLGNDQQFLSPPTNGTRLAIEAHRKGSAPLLFGDLAKTRAIASSNTPLS
ncbi:MAG: InlB B-repeat-containing protein, partial [Oscillospiraceae bacterium]|nr:InlB B-repeat-containing protein [Oscillospiraceae bacterium]